MKLSVRAKLFIVSVVVILAGGGATGFWLLGELTEYLEAQARDDLESAARTAAVMVEDLPHPVTSDVADRVADRIGKASDVRITIIGADGTVLGDSEFAGLALAELESHAERPEVIAARASGVGQSGRFSQSVETEMMYIAVSSGADGPVVRAAQRLSSLSAAMGRIRWLLLAAGGLLTVIAFAMSALASWFLSRDVNRLLNRSREIRADRTQRFEVKRLGDFTELAESVNHVLDDLAGTMTAMSSQNDRMQAVLQGMNEPVLGLDPDQTITLSNRASVELLGLSEPPIGRNLFDVLPSVELESLDFDNDGDGPRSIELELGSSRLLAQTTTQRDGAGSVLVLHDITGIRRLEKMRRDFVANVSHELRTPVAVLSANAETLLDGALDEPVIAEKLVEAIHRQSDRLSNLVADLLDISRIEAGQYHLDVEPVSVREVCQASIEAMERPASGRRMTLHLEANPALWVVADPKATEQIVTNLLDNAIKYGTPGGNVFLRARAQGARVHFEVQDDGPGIDRKHHARLFERFYRVDKGRSRGMGGTGLGLSIVKHLVETMRGRVGYRPAIPRGSVFWFALPIADAPNTALAPSRGVVDAL